MARVIGHTAACNTNAPKGIGAAAQAGDQSGSPPASR